MSYAYMMMGNYDKAIESFDTAIMMQPDSSSTYFVASLARYAQQDISGAVTALETALQKKPDYPEAARLLGQLYYMEAGKKLEAKDEAGAAPLLAKSVTAFETAYKYEPENAENITNLIEGYERTKQPEKALALNENAVAKDPKNKTFRYAYGVSLLRQEKFEKAIPEDYGELLVFLLDHALDHPGDPEIVNITDLVKCVFTRWGSVCTFADCVGSTFAIGPDGSIYPCYRFVGIPEWVMGSVKDQPDRGTLMRSEAGMRISGFKEIVDKACKECRHLRYCRGGCPYNALVPTEGEMTGIDPYCSAYQRIFDEISDRLNLEMEESCTIDIMTSPGQQGKKKRGVMSLLQRMVLQ